MDGCCCKKIVWAMFRENLPVVIRNHIAEQTFDKDTYKQIFAMADKIHTSNQAAEPPALARPTVAAVKAEQAATANVAAVAPRKPQRNKNAGGGKPPKPQAASTATTPSTSSKPKGTRHATARGKDEDLCKIHFLWGVNGNYCAAPWKCPMKDVFKAPQ